MIPISVSHSASFIWKPRGYKDQYEMDKDLVQKWNAIVQPDDEVYHLGDVMLNDNDEGMSCLRALTGHIHVIRGNHDGDKRLALYRTAPNVVETVDAKFLQYKKYHFFLSHYPCICANYDDGDSLHRKAINLCGHMHTADPFIDMDKGIIFHCEVDAHSNAPVNLDMVIAEIKDYLYIIERK